MLVTPKRNLLQRACNRALHGLGAKPFPVAFECSLPEAGAEPATVFNAIYDAAYWGAEESKSGGGSELAATEQYRPQLIRAIRWLGIKTMFDAPCGDLNWMPDVLDQVSVKYVGGDIAQEAIHTARERRPDLDIRLFDICADEFPEADLWHCRDTLFHLSFADIAKALNQASKANIEYAALTTHKAWMLRNLDIKTGGFRLLDLERPPLSFPRPRMYLRDYSPGRFPRFVGIWKMSDILERLRP